MKVSSEARKPSERKAEKEPKFKDYHKPRQCLIRDCRVTMMRRIPMESSLTMLRIREIEEKRMQQPKTNSLTALLCDDQISITSTDNSFHPTADGEQKSFCSSNSLFSSVETAYYIQRNEMKPSETERNQDNPTIKSLKVD